jgi:DNA-directed RNA polymerase subunit RPC12/RpoP
VGSRASTAAALLRPASATGKSRASVGRTAECPPLRACWQGELCCRREPQYLVTGPRRTRQPTRRATTGLVLPDVSLALLGVLIAALGVIVAALGVYYQRRATPAGSRVTAEPGLGEWYQPICARCGLRLGPAFIAIGHAAGIICPKCGARLVFLPSDDGLRCSAFLDDGHGNGVQQGPVLVTPRLPMLAQGLSLLRRVWHVGAYPEGRRAEYEELIFRAKRRRRVIGATLIVLGIALVLVDALADSSAVIAVVAVAISAAVGSNLTRLRRIFRRRRLRVRPAALGSDLPDSCWMVLAAIPPGSASRYIIGVPVVLTATGKDFPNVSIQILHGSTYGGGESLVPASPFFARTRTAAAESITDYHVPIVRDGDAVELMKPIQIDRSKLAVDGPLASLDRVHIFASASGRRRLSESFWLATVLAESEAELDGGFEEMVRAVMDREGPSRLFTPIVWWSRLTEGTVQKKHCLVINSHFTTGAEDGVAIDDALGIGPNPQTSYVPVEFEMFVRKPPLASQSVPAPSGPSAEQDVDVGEPRTIE